MHFLAATVPPVSLSSLHLSPDATVKSLLHDLTKVHSACLPRLQDFDGSSDTIHAATVIVNLSSGLVMNGPSLPGASSNGCAVVADGFVYLVRGVMTAENGALTDSSEVYRAKGRFPH